MNLSPARFDAADPADLAVLLAGVLARQAASRTAAAQARLGRVDGIAGRFGPADGRFNAEAARTLAEWKER
ncbi:hypothetical protein CKY28_10675 [Sphingomonas lenta]|uniref:Uncharacterized protein n=1 Tax=Sphingomonas lenta TaxID=1141887 RepID=A0A2A2SFT1_9SPHN|nr:hypothetical protein CKY28_10675 [Sphingomonas lenta]